MSTPSGAPHHRAVVVLGSNVDAERNVALALAALAAEHAVVATAAARWTVPFGPPGQPPFRNAAVLIATPLGAEPLRAALRELEERMGRVRSGDRYAPRPIDLDVVVWDGAVVDPDVGRRDYLREMVVELEPSALAG